MSVFSDSRRFDEGAAPVSPPEKPSKHSTDPRIVAALIAAGGSVLVEILKIVAG